jgi:beta-lactamase regulating signal transducer with metallopeptidase domain
MNAIEPLLQQPAAQAIAWALLHFIWQGTLVAAVTAVVLFLLRRSAADVRYVVASIALAVMLTVPAVTAVQLFGAIDRPSASVAIRPTQPAIDDAGARAQRRGVSDTTFTASAARVSASSRIDELGRLSSAAAGALLPAFMLAWATGVCLLSLRLLTGWWWIHRLRTHGVTPAAARWERTAARISRRLHIARAVTLLESVLVDVPTVVGWMKPVVLLPTSALAGLSPEQIEAILAHEYAHIRRHDYLVNLLQTLVETLLFYHPAVWWLSRRIRIERENCCDDLAVALCGDPVAYAAALADLEALIRSPFGAKHAFARRSAAVAATGGSLLHRVRRLLGAPDAHDTRGSAWFGAAVAIMLMCGAAYAAQSLQQTASTPPQPATPASTGAVAIAAAIALPARSGSIAAATTIPPGRPVAIAAPAAPIAASTEGQRPVDSAEAVAAAIARLQDAASTPPRASTAAIAPEAQAATTAALDRMLSTPRRAEAAMTAAAAKAGETAQSISSHQHGSSGNWVWSRNGEKLAVKYSGEFEFTDDDTDVRWISTDGWLEISDAALIARHTVEVREHGGTLERRYWVTGSERPFEPEGRQWLRDHLPQFVRNTGIGAERRVARILKSGGPPAVLAEIARIDSDYVKGVYYTQLFRQATLDSATFRQVLTQAGRDIHSNYGLATLLTSLVDRLPADDQSRAAYFEAARGISSNYELHRTYAALLKRGPMTPALVASMLQNASAIKSDYELSQLLQQVVGQQRLDAQTRGPFFAALGTISSDYERHRVLKAVISRGDADDATVAAALQAAATGSSDYERGSFLLEVVKARSIDGTARTPFFTALGRVQSAYERGRVLQAVVRDPNASHDVLLGALQSAKAMSGFELAQVLTAVAGARTLTGDLREAYIDAAERLQGYDQGRVMTALVKSERRK